MKHSIPSLAFLFIGVILSSCTLANKAANYQVTSRDPASLSQNSPTEFRIAIGTRWMVAAALEDIFGKNTVITGGGTVGDLTQGFVLNQVSSWGGPCDPYASSLPVPHAQQNGGIAMVSEVPSVRGCSATEYSQASILPGSSTSRLAWTVRSCDKIVSADAAVQFAASQVGLPANSPLTTSPTETQIKNAFNLFHPGMPISPAVFTALKAVVSETASQYPNSMEAWRFLLLTLCSTPGWQIL